MTFKYNPNIYIADLDEIAVYDAVQHAIKEYPNESCGAIIEETYVPFVNKSGTPNNQFIIDDDLWWNNYILGNIECLVHSHNNYNMASVTDQIQQRELEIQSLIINLKNKSLMDCIILGYNDIPELIGRPFFYGSFDCVSLVQDYFKLNYNIILPQPLHEWEFWLDEKNLFEEMLETTADLPFYEVNENDIQKDDILMYDISTKFINHIGVVVSDNLEVLHHYYNHVSGRYPISHNRRYLRKVLRLKK